MKALPSILLSSIHSHKTSNRYSTLSKVISYEHNNSYTITTERKDLCEQKSMYTTEYHFEISKVILIYNEKRNGMNK